MTTHIPPITEDDIAQFLTNTPGFFERHAEVLASVQITSPHGARAVSLQERQAEMLREKIKGLEHRIMEMVRTGQVAMTRGEHSGIRRTPGANGNGWHPEEVSGLAEY